MLIIMVSDSGFIAARCPGMTNRELPYGRLGSNRFSRPFQQSA